MNTQSQDRITGSTLHLRSRNSPVGGSACVASYMGELFLLSVGHNTEPSNAESLQGIVEVPIYIDLEDGQMVEVRMKSMFAISAELGTEEEEEDDDGSSGRDFSEEHKAELYSTVTNCEEERLIGRLDICYRMMDTRIPSWACLIQWVQTQKNILTISGEIILDKTTEYGCYGRVRHHQDPETDSWSCMSHFQHGMRVEKETTDMVEFRLPKVVEELEELQGLSGAPIMDSTGRLVALVSSTSVGTNRLCAFKVNRVLSFLKIETL